MPKLMDVLEYLDPTGNTLVARVPPDDSCEINWGAQLTVRESQVAVFFRDGRAITAFKPGRYVLKTQNIPILTKWVTSFGYGPKSPFRSEVYFVSTKLQHGMKWGTAQPILFKDTELQMVRLRSHGTFSVRVIEPTVFLNRMVGTQGMYTADQIQDYLRSILTARLVDVFGGVVKSVFDMPSQYDEISVGLKARARADFEAAGLDRGDFLGEAITPPEEVQKMIDERSSMAAVGDMNTYIKFKAAKSLQDAAQQGGGGGLVGAGAGLGLGMMMPQMIQQAMQQQPPAPLPAQRASVAPAQDPYELLGKLKGLLDAGALTQDEYAAKKKDLLARM